MTDLLLALSQAPEGRQDDFDKWYDEHHSPARATIPGILTGQRYKSVDDPRTSLAYYDLDSVDVLQTPEYRKLREDRSPYEQEIMAALPRLERRIYKGLEEFGGDRYSPEQATHLLAVWMTLGPNQDEELGDWYRREHAPELLKVDGWLRIRRFELVEGPGPKFLALHDLEGLGVFDDPQYARARDTPWRDRIVDTRVEYERSVYALHRRFP